MAAPSRTMPGKTSHGKKETKSDVKQPTNVYVPFVPQVVVPEKQASDLTNETNEVSASDTKEEPPRAQVPFFTPTKQAPVLNPVEQKQESVPEKPTNEEMKGKDVSASEAKEEPPKAQIPFFTPTKQAPVFTPVDQKQQDDTPAKPVSKPTASPDELRQLAAEVATNNRTSTKSFRERARDIGSLERRFCDGLSHVTSTSDLLATLESDDVKKSLDFCISHSEWDTALVLASTISPDELARVTRLFIKSKFANDADTACAMLTLTGNTCDSWQSTLRNSLLLDTHAALAKEMEQQQKEGNIDAVETMRPFIPLEAKPRSSAPTPASSRKRRSLVTDDMFLDERSSAQASPQKPVERKPEPSPQPQPQPQPEPQQKRQEPPKAEEPKKPAPNPEPEQEQENQGWFGGFFRRLNPFAAKPTKTVDLSEHEGDQLVWDGTKYVVKGQEKAEETAPPPPPPTAKPPQPSPAGAAPPPTLGPRTGRRTRATGRYVNSF